MKISPIFAIVISIVITLLGIISITGLPVEQYPDISPPVVRVTANYQGADAVTTDQAVATPVSQAVMGVSDMLYMQSTSDNTGRMSLQVTFKVGSDPDMDAVFTQNNVSTAVPMLPAPVTQQGVVTKKAMPGYLVLFALGSDGRYGGDYLANYAYINLVNELLKVDGVGDVQVMGSGEYSMRIWVRPDLMEYYGVSPQDIAAAIESQSGVFPAGVLDGEPQSVPGDFTYTVVSPPQITTPEEYGRIVIKTDENGDQTLLSDVARVELGNKTYGVSSTLNGSQAAVMMVYQSPGSNAIAVCDGVKARMKELSERMPQGMHYLTVVDTTESINAGIRDILMTLLIALGLVIVIIYVFIQDLRATLIPLVAIPVSLVGAFIVFPFLGFSVNIISLLGLVLAIGLVVDDAIVVVEAVQGGIERGLKPKKAVTEAMAAVRSPIIATTVVLCAVLIPVSLIGGITGKLYAQFAATIAFSVVISALNALTLSPTLCALLLRSKPKREKGFFGAFNRGFEKWKTGYLSLSGRIAKKGWAVAGVLALIGGAYFIMSRTLPKAFLPDEDQGYLMVNVQLPDAASRARTAEVLGKVEKVIREHPEVEYVSSVAGFDILSSVASTNTGIMFVTLKDYADRKRTAMELIPMLNRRIYSSVAGARAFAFGPQAIPGLGASAGVSFLVEDRGGNTIQYLADHSARFLQAASKLPELTSVSSQFSAVIPQREAVIDRDMATLQGVSMGDLHAMLTTFMGGQYLNNFNRFGRLYQTYIQADASYRKDAESLNEYYIKNAKGESVPLSAFVTLKDTVGVAAYTRFNLYPAVEATGAPSLGHSTAQAMDALEKLAQDSLPADMALEWKGVSFQERSASSSTGVVYMLALVFVFLSLAALYNSWSLPLTILIGVPISLAGAMAVVSVVHIFSPGFNNNLFMQISLVMLIGLSSKNAILIVEYASTIFFKGEMSLAEAARQAAGLRVRPILMTALAFILGAMPLIFASGAYSSARHIMGLALAGGMLLATLLGIFAYPALFVLAGKLSRFEKKREKQKSGEDE